jgi:hypothetical protein
MRVSHAQLARQAFQISIKRELGAHAGFAARAEETPARRITYQMGERRAELEHIVLRD